MAQTIRQALAHAQNGETIADLAGDGIEEAEEGRVITALHRRYERNSALVQAKSDAHWSCLGGWFARLASLTSANGMGTEARALSNATTSSR